MDVKLKYKNSLIGSLDASGTKTLLTSGKYCEDDIEVEYTKPPSGRIIQDENGYVHLSDDGTLVAEVPLSVTSNGTYTPNSGYAYSSVNVNVQPTLGTATVTPSYQTQEITPGQGEYGLSKVTVNPIPNPIADENDVIFIDYDGEIRYSYSASEFANLSALPANPSHDGLTAQGWNWTMADAKTYVTKYGMHCIGQVYDTVDRKTHLYIDLPEGYTSPYVGVAGQSGYTALIEWGDGQSDNVTFAGTTVASTVWTQHDYANSGEYEIKISSQKTIWFIGSAANVNAIITHPTDTVQRSAYRSSLRSVRFGGDVRIDSYAFYGFRSLQSVTIPNTAKISGYRSFPNNTNLRAFVFPSSSILGFEYGEMFAHCYNLRYVSFPKNAPAFYNAEFYDCSTLRRLCVPENNTSLSQDICRDARSLNRVAIPDNVTEFKRFTFSGSNIRSIRLPPNHATLTGGYHFNNCTCLLSIDIPASVTAIPASTFVDCSALGEIIFNRATPPTVANSNAFNGGPVGRVIYVPFSSLAAYLTATNYPDPATYTYVGFATYENGVTLPTQDSTQAYNVTWYATKADAMAQTNSISVGNGNRIFCRYTAV